MTNKFGVSVTGCPLLLANTRVILYVHRTIVIAVIQRHHTLPKTHCFLGIEFSHSRL